jgi:hypothetical protein
MGVPASCAIRAEPWRHANDAGLRLGRRVPEPRASLRIPHHGTFTAMVLVRLPAEQSEHRVVMSALPLPGFFVAVYAHGTPPENEWARYVEMMRAMKGPPYRALAFSAGGGPSALQRRDIETVSNEHGQVRAAAVTSDKIARGIVTALSWIRRDTFKAFPPEEVDSAYGYIEASPAERDAANAFVRAMAAKLGVSKEIGF